MAVLVCHVLSGAGVEYLLLLAVLAHPGHEPCTGAALPRKDSSSSFPQVRSTRSFRPEDLLLVTVESHARC